MIYEMDPIMMANDQEQKTTFWNDFCIADRSGEKAIKDTSKRAFKSWKNDVVYLTELVQTLNHKIWIYHNRGNEKLARLYDALWREADQYACENLEGDDASYFFRMTD